LTCAAVFWYYHKNAAKFYDQEVENRLTVLTTMIESLLMTSMGIVVALYLPIFEMGARLK
jgi:type II secretory pathway component PulF